MMKNKKNIALYLIPYFFSLVICLLLSYTIGYYNLSLDEAFSVKLAGMPITDLIVASAKDVHPPLYYIILKFAGLIGGNTLLSYRIITVIPVWIILFYIGAYKLAQRYGIWSSLFFILCFGGAYYTCDESMNIRMYSWAACLVILSFYTLLEWFETHRKKHLILACVYTVCAMYTHYFALLFCFFMWLAFGIKQIIKSVKSSGEKKYIREIIICAVIFISLYLPWLGAIVWQSKRLTNSGWLESVSFSWCELGECIPEIIQKSDMRFGIAVYIVLLVLLLSGVIKQKQGVTEVGLAAIFTMLSGAIISIVVSPLWVTRFGYTFWGVIPLAASFVLETESLKNMKERTIGIIARILIILFVFANCIVSFSYFFNDEAIKISGTEWNDFTHSIDGDIMFIDSHNEFQLIFDYFLPNSEIVMVHDRENIAVMAEILDKNKDKSVWYVTDPRTYAPNIEIISQTLSDEGYVLSEPVTYFIRYKTLNVYKVEAK